MTIFRLNFLLKVGQMKVCQNPSFISTPFEKVHYQTPQPHVLRDTDSGDYDVNSITLSVKDEKGNLFDFNNHPLEFELEIN